MDILEDTYTQCNKLDSLLVGSWMDMSGLGNKVDMVCLGMIQDIFPLGSI